MKKIDPNQISENFFRLISKEWMLVTAGNCEKFNTMTASWGGTGFLWNKPVVFIFIRPERYTYEFIENNPCFTLSFLGEANKAIHKVCGSKSGRDTDKISETGLQPYPTENGNILFRQARIGIECKKLYTTVVEKDQLVDPEIFDKWYGDQGGLHKMYIAEILNLWIEE